jgi:predicted O-methyltransferase YrrM
MDYLVIMRVDPHTFAENFIAEDYFKSQARARGVELGTVDTTPGAGAFLRYLASTLKAQSVVEVGTGSGVGSLWLFDGMLPSGRYRSKQISPDHKLSS